MTTVSPTQASAEADGIDTSARCPLGLLLAMALLWVLAGGVLAVLNLLQLQSPALLADCAWFSYGRLQAMQETAFLYGWAINAGVAVATWLLVRLSGEALRGANYLMVGTLFWNAALVLALVGIAGGYATSHSYFQLPSFVQPALLVAYSVMAVPGILAWTGRRKEHTYATQWYAVAALFLLPWFFSVAQVMLTFLPVRGVLQAVLATWYAQNLFSLWLAPIALAALYYLLPKLTGRTLPNYDFAIYGFWSLLAFGTWMGGRQLIGGPVPAWIATIAITASVMVLFHYLIVFLNLRSMFRLAGSTVLFLLMIGLAAYLVGGVVDAVFATRALAKVTQFTYFQQAQQQLHLGAFSLVMFATLYFMAPRLAGAAWPSIALLRAHFLAVLIAFGLLVVSLAAAGWIQGAAMNDAAVSFATIGDKTRPWLQLAAVAQGVALCGNALLALNFLRLFFTKSATDTVGRAAMEASAS
jgi:cytochrome c oxidase cbb3-type subunit 1